MRIVYRHIRPVAVIYVRGTGCYAAAAKEAWQRLVHWLAAHEARRQVKRAFGLLHDNPQTTPVELMRYDACAQMTPEWDAEHYAGISRKTIGGGTYAVRTHVGSYGTLGGLFSQLHRELVPKQGLSVDYDRAFMAIHLNDPLTTPEVHRRTELCVPVVPLPVSMPDDADAHSDCNRPVLRVVRS